MVKKFAIPMIVLFLVLAFNLHAIGTAIGNLRAKITVNSETSIYVEDFANPSDPDDTLAIQSAINYVSKLPSGGTVLLQNKTYRISKPLKITTLGVGIKGERPGWPGGGGTMIHQLTPDTDVIQIIFPQGSNLYGNAIENIGVNSGPNWDTDTNKNGSGIFVQGALGTVLRNINVLNAYIGIHIHGSINVGIENCKVARLYRKSEKTYGILFDDDGIHPNASNWIKNTIVSFPKVEGGISYGLAFMGMMQDLTVNHLEVTGPDYGLYFKRDTSRYNYDIQISHVIIDQFLKTGAYFEGFGDGSPNLVSGWFANAPSESEQNAIHIKNSNGMKIRDVEFFGSNFANKNANAIKLENSTHSLINGNSFRNWFKSIVVNQSSNIVIANNSFNNIAASSYDFHVYIAGQSNRVNVSGNTFSGSNNTKNALRINTGSSFNLVSNNTWTGPFVDSFVVNDGGESNSIINNVGN